MSAPHRQPHMSTADRYPISTPCAKFSINALNEIGNAIIDTLPTGPDSFESLYNLKAGTAATVSAAPPSGVWPDRRALELRSRPNWLIQEQLLLADAAESLVDATRDAKCHEVVMLFIHHVTDDEARLQLSNTVQLPLLPLQPPAGSTLKGTSKLVNRCQSVPSQCPDNQPANSSSCACISNEQFNQPGNSSSSRACIGSCTLASTAVAAGVCASDLFYYLV